MVTVPLLTNLGLRDQLALLKIHELKHNAGIRQILKKLYEKLFTRALWWRLGNVGVLEHKDPYGYNTLAHYPTQFIGLNSKCRRPRRTMRIGANGSDARQHQQ
jgi:hypothetical protein